MLLISSVKFSHSVVSDSLQPHGLQHTRFPCPSATPGATQTHVHHVGDVNQPSHPLSSPSPPAFNPSQQQGFSNESDLHIRWPKYWSFSFSIRPSNEYSGLIFLGNKLFWSPYSPGNSQESSPIQQLKSINSSVISLVYGPALIHDYQKTIVLTFWGLCQQSDVSAF